MQLEIDGILELKKQVIANGIIRFLGGVKLSIMS